MAASVGVADEGVNAARRAMIPKMVFMPYILIKVSVAERETKLGCVTDGQVSEQRATSSRSYFAFSSDASKIY